MMSAEIEKLYQQESRRVFASLVRLLRDFDLAEEALHEAFAAALATWPRDGQPENPVSWLISTGRFKAIEMLRRQSRLEELNPILEERRESIQAQNAELAEHEVEDDRLRLIFTCCHPAIDPKVQVALTLREVCGLTTEEIARAFLTTPPTMAQRIVRGKAKIRDAGIPFVIPPLEDLPRRLETVLSVIYLVFNEGYSASSGESLTRVDLSNEAIRLARVVLDLMPDAEVLGLLALMLFHESRRPARTDEKGDIVLLEDQDRGLWNQDHIREAEQLITRAMETGEVGSYVIQASISGAHARAASAEETDWDRIVGLYDLLLRAQASPVVALNRAVAIAMRDGPRAGLELLDELMKVEVLQSYYLAHSARAELLRRLGDLEAARSSFERALDLARQEPERRFLRRKLAALDELGS